jgi:hypothetical protein
MKISAILSTTVLPLDGNYAVQTLETIPEIGGIAHYIGHPATKQIVEQLGAAQAASKLFTGLSVGESAIAVSIKQGLSTRATEGFTSPHQEVDINMLTFRLITRLPDKLDHCCNFYCGNRDAGVKI